MDNIPNQDPRVVRTSRLPEADSRTVNQRIDTNENTRLNQRVAAQQGTGPRDRSAYLDEADFDAQERKERRPANRNRTSYSSGRDSIARYRLTEQAFIDNILMEAGTEIDYDGVPGPHMEPLNDLAFDAKDKAPEYSSLNQLPVNLNSPGEPADQQRASIDRLIAALEGAVSRGAIPTGEGNDAAINDEVERRVAVRMRELEEKQHEQNPQQQS